VALSGGVGGAKLALGLSHVMPPEQLAVVVNTADDFVHLGLPVSPDIDTLLYTLSGQANPEQGWGRKDESWRAMAALEALGGETWFKLGDLDMATHLVRGELLRQGQTLTQVTDYLRQRLSIATTILPMTDDPVATLIKTPEGKLSFQHYFVRAQCQPQVSGIEFRGIENAEPNPQWLALLKDPDLLAIVVCPSNPFVSVDPILSLPGVVAAIRATAKPVIAVSPVVAGQAIKGPTAKMMAEMSMPVSAAEVAAYYDARYSGLISGYVIDESDQNLEMTISQYGAVEVAPTVMKTLEDKKHLADVVLGFSLKLQQGSESVSLKGASL
jgi:LPPG:FO 2-phospho-L-lactate transferase